MPRFYNCVDSPQPCLVGCLAWTSTALTYKRGASSIRILVFRSDFNTSGTRHPLWPILFSVYAHLHPAIAALVRPVRLRFALFVRLCVAAPRENLR